MKIVLFLIMSFFVLSCSSFGKGSRVKDLRVGMKESEVVSFLNESPTNRISEDDGKYILKYRLHEYFKGYTYFYLLFNESHELLEWRENTQEYWTEQSKLLSLFAISYGNSLSGKSAQCINSQKYQGCCSYHGGLKLIDSCPIFDVDNRIICEDNTSSPTCFK